MAIIVFQHDESNRPGRLGRVLRDQAHALDIRRLDRGAEVPPDFDNVTGVVSLGGPPNVSDAGTARAPWMAEELAFLREAHARQLPLIGVCLGAQMIAHALGGEVEPMAETEVGFHTISLTPAAHTEIALAGIPWDHAAFCHHGQQVTKMPEGATKLASSKKCGVQAFRVGLRTYAFQWHFEADRDGALDIHRASSEKVVTEADLRSQFETHGQAFARLSDRLSLNLASFVIPAGKRVGAAGGIG